MSDTVSPPALSPSEADQPLDQEIAEVRRLQAAAGVPEPLSVEPFTEARRHSVSWRTRFYPQVGLPVHSIVDVAIPGADGDIRARVIRPQGIATSVPTVIYLHGGAWILGDLDSHEGHARRIAQRIGAVVVNVEYRLAPEHPFPAGYEDAVAALEWVHAHIGELGGDPDAVGIAGDSAGGNLAAATAVAAVDRELPLKAQLLIYPVTDFTRIVPGRVEEAYFGTAWEGTRTDPRASPIFAADLAGLPTTIIGVGSHDRLHADNRAFADALTGAGVPVTLRVYPTLPHGFFSAVSVSEQAARAADELAYDFGAALSTREH